MSTFYGGETIASSKSVSLSQSFSDQQVLETVPSGYYAEIFFTVADLNSGSLTNWLAINSSILTGIDIQYIDLSELGSPDVRNKKTSVYVLNAGESLIISGTPNAKVSYLYKLYKHV